MLAVTAVAVGVVALGDLAVPALLSVGATTSPTRSDAAAPRGSVEEARPSSVRPSPVPPLLLVVVDGLREDATRAMSAWASFAGAAVPVARGVALVGDPSMSAPCVRAIVTGRAPDLWTSFRNFDPLPVRSSVLHALAARGARVAHAGDPLLPSLCPDVYAAGDVVAAPRVPGLGPDAVRRADDLAFPAALRLCADPGIDVLTVHLVTVDLVAHASGATGAAYAAAVAEADTRLSSLVASFCARRPGATVLLAADHGLSPAGTHGSGEPDARRAPFVLAGPRVASRAGALLRQEALASTLCAALDLPPPEEAEVPPDLSLLALPPAARRDALASFLAVRAAALARRGAHAHARALDEAQAGVRQGDPAALETALALLPAAAPRPVSWLSKGMLGLAAVGGLSALVLLLGASRRDAATVLVAGGVALSVGGAGRALHVGLVAAEAGAWGLRLVAVVGTALVVGRSLLRRRPGRLAPPSEGDTRPWVAAVVIGAGLASLRAFRLPVDGVVHLPWLVGGLLVLGVACAAWRARAATTRTVRVAATAATALFVGATRGLEQACGEGFAAAEGTSVVVPLALLAALGVAAAVAARLPSRGGAGTVALLLFGAVAAFHALGGAESIGRLDPGRRFVPGAAGAVPEATAWGSLVGAALRQGVVWLALLLAARAALARGGAPERLPGVVAALGVALAAGAVVLVLGGVVWSAWAWWMVVAVAVYLLVGVDAAALALAGTAALVGPRVVRAVAGRVRRRAAPGPSPPAPEPLRPRALARTTDG